MNSPDTIFGLNATGWSAAQAIISFLGVVGLGFYVEFTRRIMKATEITRRAEFEPFLALEHQKEVEDGIPVRLHNLGRGGAIGIEHWILRGTSLSLSLDKPIPRPADRNPLEDLIPDLGDIMPGECDEVQYPIKLSGVEQELHVYQALDVTGQMHQLQVLYKTNNNRKTIWTVNRLRPFQPAGLAHF